MAGDRYASRATRGWRATDEGLLLELDGALALVSIAEDGSVRLRASSGDELPPPFEPGIGRAPWQPVACRTRSDDRGARLEHRGPLGEVSVELTADPFSLRISDRQGTTLAAFEGLAFDDGDGGRIVYRAERAERFSGFGETLGGLDKRGRKFLMRNRDPGPLGGEPFYLNIPFFLGIRADGRSCGVLLDAFGPARFDVAATDPDEIALESDFDGVDLTLFPGPRPADVLRRFTGRVGRTPLPPRWALGHHQSRWSYSSEREVRKLAGELRDRGFPTDAIHLDIDYMNGFRVFSWNAKRFPEPARLIADLAARGLRVVTIVDPGVKAEPGWPVFEDGVERDVFCRSVDGRPFTLRVWPKDAALPDFNRESVRRWWGEQHRVLLDAGVAGIWNDMNEPAGWARDMRLGRAIVPLRKQDLSDVEQSDPATPERRVPHEHVRNLYGHQQCRATRDHLERARPGQRPFVLTRSGHTGIQRWAAVWTGDNASRWSHLRGSIPMLLNLSVSGVAFCGADIGGFALSCSPELFARWIQLGALQPFARTHCIWLGRRQEPWSFGPRVEAIARDALALRMRLLPYLYGLFREAEELGAPVWRPLFYEFPDDPDAARVEDQLMIGPSLLAAPVVERGARERVVYLPPGRWLCWHDDAAYVGPRRLRVEAPLARLPLFVRAGSVLPTQSPVLHTDEEPAEACVLEVFPGADGTSRLVEDDGETTEYLDGAVAATALRLWDRAGGRLRLEIGRREGSFEPGPRTTRVCVRACPTPNGVYLDGVPLERRRSAPGWSLEEGRLQVRIPDSGNGHALEVDPAP